jgi:S-adenosylmethionine:tRNA ribosyltransferase-isomerase
MSELLSDYNYPFPEELIAQAPLPTRHASRMLVLSRATGQRTHSQFLELPDFLTPHDVLVFNNTSVFPSRLFAKKPTGGKVEIFLLREQNEKEWSVFLSPARGLKEGMQLLLFSRKNETQPETFVTITSLKEDDFRIRFNSEFIGAELLKLFGEMPLPPYIRREKPITEDQHRYQTIFAKKLGAVAAPTAGLHFSEEMVARLKQAKIPTALITLHVGAGTFLPVKTENIEEHRMHEEYFEISEETLQKIRECQIKGGKIFAVGTTTLRALESWALTEQSSGWTKLFIRPGFSFKVVDRLLTNFHQPKSTLLMLVSAFAGREKILTAYQEAIQNRYRLFSYGDCMLIL